VDVSPLPEHPSWCNRRHQVGANPKRQEHKNIWRTIDRRYQQQVSLYPCAPHSLAEGGESHAGAFVTVEFFGDCARGYLSADELRSLGDRLHEIADAVQA